MTKSKTNQLTELKIFVLELSWNSISAYLLLDWGPSIIGSRLFYLQANENHTKRPPPRKYVGSRVSWNPHNWITKTYIWLCCPCLWKFCVFWLYLSSYFVCQNISDTRTSNSKQFGQDPDKCLDLASFLSFGRWVLSQSFWLLDEVLLKTFWVPLGSRRMSPD